MYLRANLCQLHLRVRKRTDSINTYVLSTSYSYAKKWTDERKKERITQSVNINSRGHRPTNVDSSLSAAAVVVIAIGKSSFLFEKKDNFMQQPPD